MALSACKDDALVQDSDCNDVLANTVEDQIFKGRLGNDAYSYPTSRTDEIMDTGGGDELRVSVVDAEGVSIQTSFKRVGDDLVVTQSGDGNGVTVVGAIVACTALGQVSLFYEDGKRPDNVFHFIGNYVLSNLRTHSCRQVTNEEPVGRQRDAGRVNTYHG